MRTLKKIVLLLGCLVSFITSGWGQCPGKAVLWKRIVYLRDSTKVPDPDQLAELFPYLEKIKSCPWRNDSTHTILLLRVAWLFAKEKDFVKAIGYTHQAIGIIYAHSGDPGTSQKQLIRGYNNLRICYDSLNQQDLRKEALDSCITVILRLGTGFEYAGLIGSRAESLYKSGDYYRSLSFATQGEALCRKGNRPLTEILFCLTWRINSLIGLNRYDEAAELSEKALAECREKNDKVYPGSFYNLLATSMEEKGDSAKAVLYANRSFFYNAQIKNDKGSGEALNNLGYLLYFKNLHQYDAALRCYKKALRYAIASDSMVIFGNIANVYAEKGLFDSAFYYFRQGFGVLGPGMDEKKIMQNGREGLADGTFADYPVNLILDKGNALLKKYKSSQEKETLRQAIATYTSLDRLLDKIRKAQTEVFSKLFWRSEYRRLYENAIEACWLDGNASQAFYFFEKSKAVLLSDQLSEQHGLNNEEVLKLAQVKRKILRLDQQLNSTPASAPGATPASGSSASSPGAPPSPGAPSPTGREPIERELFAARQELARREQLVKKQYPLYSQSFQDSSQIGLQKVQELLLTGHQAFLELFSGDKAVYTLLTDRQGARLSRIDKPDFDSTLRVYLTVLSNPDLLNDHYALFTKTAAHLYQLIFGDHPLPDGRIIISPDGRFFPFEALVVKNDARSPVYFLEGQAVSYTHSARYLLNDPGEPTTGASPMTGPSSTAGASPTTIKGDFLGVAPVQYSGGLGLPALPGSEQSLGRIASYFEKTKNLLSGQATRYNFLHQFYAFTVIQLYTHASDGMGGAGSGARPGNAGPAEGPMGIGVSMGGSGAGDPVIWFADSALALAELIPDSKPVTRLIVLSACETGNGRVYEGEGVFSFNRGFAALGIPSSVTNLWAVDDQATYRITELFYRYLSEGMPLDQALQKAKTDYIKSSSRERALPYYWAAAILSGDTRAVNLRPAHSPLREILIILSILALALIMRSFRTTRPKR